MSHWVALGVTLVSVFLPVVHSAFDLNTVPSRSIPVCMNHILFTQFSQWTFWLLLCCGCCKQCCHALWYVCIFFFFFFYS